MRQFPVHFKLSLLALLVAQTHSVWADEVTNNSNAVLPTIKIEAMSELDPIKSYIDYDQANVTRNGLKKKDIPQTIDTIDVQKYKIYGANDLSVMLQGTPGVSTNYDMRGDGIMLRGFSADTGDIYRDGVRESGQIRRSTANVERIEILKGPASVLYGRSGGGGVINMVTKFANFESPSTVGLYTGSYNNVGGTIDLNQIVNDNWAVRLVGEKSDTNSFRSGIGANELMLSPSITYRSDDHKLLWTTEATYDKLNRVPDRGPSYNDLASDLSIKQGFAQNGDYVNDVLKTARTDVKYEFAPNWKFHWGLSHRETEQNFDHFYAGTLCSTDATPSNGESDSPKSPNYVAPADRRCNGNVGKISQVYYWQQTTNKTTSNTWDITGEFHTGAIKHNILIGTDWTYEQREPLLSNKNVDNSVISGFFDPQTGQLSQFNRDNHEKLITAHNYNEGTNYGAFVQDLVSFNDQFKMMLGLRYDYYEAKTTDKLATSKTYGQSTAVTNETVSPNIGFVWQPVPAHSLYASYSKSFSPFGGNMGLSVVSATQNLATFDAEPQYNDQYEIGIKSDWFNERLNTQLSFFDIRKHNIRYQPDSTNQPNVWATAGEYQSKGAEFSFIGRVLDNVFVRGGYGYTDAKVKENQQYPSTVDNPLDKVSKNTGNLFVRYLPTENIYLETGVTYQGSFYSYPNGNLSRTPVKIDGFNRMDAAVGYKNEHWGMTLAVNNLTNKEYWRSDSMPGTPRNYLLRLNYQF
ncbi:TonB-dependent siderophore receptor [Acinetobacter sp. MD2]|uniref:TonB-dependent receptor n=1 Tax=Acinetobacter sp. MD2 TaxID=2600066 RepID=UPI002D1F1340|nr:TonB-dependent siderophore receptor [Acinetobacter sp. MD2]MEB3766155.1 TonB-dependent siderophore receptor [Acinetobacter sp. MD2]